MGNTEPCHIAHKILDEISSEGIHVSGDCYDFSPAKTTRTLQKSYLIRARRTFILKPLEAIHFLKLTSKFDFAHLYCEISKTNGWKIGQFTIVCRRDSSRRTNCVNTFPCVVLPSSARDKYCGRRPNHINLSEEPLSIRFLYRRLSKHPYVPGWHPQPRLLLTHLQHIIDSCRSLLHFLSCLPI